jgi:hydroxyethylthiazole kinase-like uncharacterized protein yjeF
MDTALYLTASLRQIEAAHAGQPLMQRAGAAAAQLAMQLLGTSANPVLILAGPGNNGGDAFEMAMHLRAAFFDVRLVFIGDGQHLPADAAAARQRYLNAGGTVVAEIPANQRWSLIVDGLFGIGLTRAPEGTYAALIDAANRLAGENNCPLLALDSPSGLNADTGQTAGKAIRASHTLTFIASKPGLHTADGPDHCGALSVATLDIEAANERPADGHVVTRADFSACLQPRPLNSHKGVFGNAGVLGGAPTMVGAAFLGARAALKLGAGRVYVGLIDHTTASFDPQQPELMFRRPQALLQTGLDALVCGPGLGISLEASELLEAAIGLDLALVLDADAVNLLASESNLETAFAKRKQPAILTPHPAEAARLLECSTAEVQADRIAAAIEIARRYHSLVALKGCGTVIATVDGRWWLNSSGNPGMATAGMGDVLSGIIAALLAQGWPAEQALLGGVHLHGAAADRLVADGIGPIGLAAGEVIDAARCLLNEWVGTGKAC